MYFLHLSIPTGLMFPVTGFELCVFGRNVKDIMLLYFSDILLGRGQFWFLQLQIMFDNLVKVMSHSEQVYLLKDFVVKYFETVTISSLVKLLIDPFKHMWTCGILFYSMDYTPLSSLFIFTFNSWLIGQWEPFQTVFWILFDKSFSFEQSLAF